MNTRAVLLTVAACAVVAYFGQKSYMKWTEDARKQMLMDDADIAADIQEHAKEFMTKEVIKVTDHVYVAIGYALANSILIDGPDGLVIVDVTESYQSALEILGAFRNVTKKPIRALIYTHSHADHINGAKAFVEDDANPPDVWAHDSIIDGLQQVFSGPTTVLYARTMRQFGVFLPELSAGIGLELNFGKGGSIAAPLYPNRLVEGSEQEVTIAGIAMRLIHIPGETDDQLGIWLPEWKMFLCADDVYKAFPNLYAIRGTKSRDVMKWVSSLDKIIALTPEILVPSHTRPVFGRETILQLLVSYRDAIQYIHDQTVRNMNTGMHPNEIAKMVKLPEHLAKNPYLKEFYGTTEWSVKGVYNHYVGWFSGDPVELSPLPRLEKAQRMVALVGEDKLLQGATEALSKLDYQWALELSSYILLTNEHNKQAKDIKVRALTALGGRQTSVNGRNYYLTSAMELVADLKYKIDKEAQTTYIDYWPLDMIMSRVPIQFQAENCANRNETLFFEFHEPDSRLFIQIRNSIAIVRAATPESWNIKVSLKERTWRDIIAQRRSAVTAIALGDMTVEGGVLSFRSFMKCFDLQE